MRKTLNQILWRSGIRSIIFGSSILFTILFFFLFTEFTNLYSETIKLLQYSSNINSKHIEVEERKINKTLINISSQISAAISEHTIIANFINPNQISSEKIKNHLIDSISPILNKAYDKQDLESILVVNENGLIISKVGIKDYTLLSDEFISTLPYLNQDSPVTKSTKQHIITFLKIPNTNLNAKNYYLISFKKNKLKLYEHQTSLESLLEDTSKIKEVIRIIIIAFFFIILITLISYILYIQHVIKKRINKALSSLMLLAKQVNQKNFHPSNDISKELEIMEFQTLQNTLLTSFNNITEANIFLRSKNILIKKIIENISSGILLLDNKKEIVLYNKQTIKILKIANTNILIHQHISEILDKHLPECSALIDEIFKTKKHSEIIINQGMRKIKVKLSYIGGYTDQYHSQDHHVLLAIEDLTYQISSQKQAAWKDVARVIAHEVKNPLTPTKLCAEMLKDSVMEIDSPLSKETQIKYLSTIIRNVDHVNKLIQDFTSFTKHAQQTLNVESVNLEEVINEIVDMLKISYPKVHFETKLTPDHKTIQADKKQIWQAMLNLIQNAAQAFDPNQPSPKITIETEVNDKHLDIKIIDNGSGLPIENVNKLFQPYMTTKSYGTGLGLVIVQSIAQAHGGNANLSNNPEQGATAIFSISL